MLCVVCHLRINHLYGREQVVNSPLVCCREIVGYTTRILVDDPRIQDNDVVCLIAVMRRLCGFPTEIEVNVPYLCPRFNLLWCEAVEDCPRFSALRRSRHAH